MDKAKQCSDAAQGGIGVKKSVSLESSIKRAASIKPAGGPHGQSQSANRGKDNG